MSVKLKRRLAALCSALLLAGCAHPGAADPVASSMTQSRQWEGTVVRKGPDFGGWWALVDAKGQAWRMNGLTAEDQAKLAKLQYRRIQVQGHPGQPFLSVPVIIIERWQPQP